MEFYRNIKNRKKYRVIDNLVVDATNGRNNDLMVLYKDEAGRKYVRERKEFYEKFDKVKGDK